MCCEATRGLGFRVRHPARSQRRGFSLLEMLFVFVLIGLAATLITVNARSLLTKGKQKAARAEVANISSALEAYYSAAGRYPDNDDGLALLATKSDEFPEPLLKQPLLDPWGREYQYNRPGPGEEPYEVICFGADGREGGEGADADIHSWDAREKAGK